VTSRIGLVLACAAALAACKNEATPVAASSTIPVAQAPLRIGATKVPHGELLRAVAKELEGQGVRLEVREFDDYARANIAVARGDLDANFFQTEPYLWRWRAAHGAPLVVVGRVHVEPMALYSSRHKTLEQLQKGAKAGDAIALPDDPANLGRALFVLQRAGLIRVDERRGLDAGVGDVVENKLGLKFRLEPAQRVAEQLGSSAGAVLNGNFALQAKLDPKAALASEGADSPFPNVVVAREDRAADPRLHALVAALRGPAARQLLETKYAGSALLAQ
jgi:D-methionine transport system substrate-binding protein